MAPWPPRAWRIRAPIEFAHQAAPEAFQVDGKDPVPLILRIARRRRVRGWDASVVECVVEPVAPLQHLVDRRVDLAVGGDIAANEQRLTARNANTFGDLLAEFLLDIGQRDGAPSAASRRAAASPIPEEPPVTKATFPSNFPGM
jgi:hypothetical protein